MDLSIEYTAWWDWGRGKGTLGGIYMELKYDSAFAFAPQFICREGVMMH